MADTYRKRISTSQPFKMLVAHLERASDPSKGEAGNPVVIRQSFETQVITTPEGIGLIGNISSNRPSLIIKVNSTEYGNTNVVAGPPFYDNDTIQVYAGGIESLSSMRVLQAGYDFGKAQGNGQGNTADVAASLNEVINAMSFGVSSVIDPNDATQVIVSSDTPTDPIVLNTHSVSFNLFNGNPPFVILDSDGNTLHDPAVSGKANARILIRSTGVQPMTSN